MELEEVQEIRRLYLYENKGLEQIAELHGTSKNRIRLTLERSQYEPFPFRSRGKKAGTGLTANDKNNIYAAYHEQGLTMEKIADLWHTNKMRISRILRDFT